jgi:imidazolonepropionase-like amidohydrolase
MARRELPIIVKPPDEAKPKPSPVRLENEAVARRIHSRNLGVAVTTAPFSSRQESQQNPTKNVLYTIVLACVLIPGDGDPQPEAAVVVEGKLIVWVGPQAELPSKYTDAPHKSHSVPYLMPGLWDCHCHFEGVSTDPNEWASNPGAIDGEHPATFGARLARQCWEAMQRGYTSLRDLGGYGCEVARAAVGTDAIVAPNIYSAGACISQLAGHGDIFERPAGDVLLNWGVSQPQPGHFASKTTCVVDGPDECRRAVRLQIRRGARCIKVLASGGVLSRDDDPQLAQFSPEELNVIVSEASRMGRVVAAHVHGKPGILAAVRAGVTSVEHVTFADQECVDLIKEKGVVYVATRTIIDVLIRSGGEGLPPSVREKLALVNAHHLDAYRRAVASGVTIALGTDTPPGYNMAVELEHAVDAGLTSLEAIKAATANGPLTVGSQAPLSGQVRVGYEADMLGVWDDPVADVRILQNKENIVWVWKGGKLFKGPGIGPWGDPIESTYTTPKGSLGFRK